MNLPFLEELHEARYYNDGSSIRNKTAAELAEAILLLTFCLEIMRVEVDKNYHFSAREYAEKTLRKQDFSYMCPSQTDYYNLVSVLANQDKFLQPIYADFTISVPLLQLKRYLTDMKYENAHHSQDRAFLLILETYFRINKYSSIRRIVGDWHQASTAEKHSTLTTLRAECNERALQTDLYVIFKRTHNL